MDTQIIFDKDGYPHFLVASNEDKILNLYFKGDVQYNPFLAQRIIDQIDAVILRESNREKIVGNAFRLILTFDTVRIESLYNEPPVTLELPIKEFRDILAKWLSAIKTLE